MRIAIFFPRFKTFSGAEHLLLEFTRYAADEGHDVVILTRRFHERCRSRLHSRVEIRVPRLASALTGNHLIDSFLDTALSPWLLPLLPKEIDVLCFWCPPVAPAMWLSRHILRHRLPTAYYCLQPPRFAYDLLSETIAANKPLGYLVPMVAAPYRLIDRFAARACDRLLAISQDYAEWCRQLYKGPPVELVCPGIDTDLSREARPEWVRERHNLGSNEKLVVTVNKLIVRKNLDVFLKAMRLVVDRLPETRGIIVGDGPIEPDLINLRHRLGLEDYVTFTGFVPDFHDVAHYFAAGDVYVFLEKNVPFGLTVLEAGSCYTPSVAVSGGGTRETVIDGKTGFLVGEALDVEEVADRICWFLEHDQERREMGRNAFQFAQQFSWKCSGQAFVECLERVAAFQVAGRTGSPK
ncbi:MAG: glycosyltransferase family 4 protein [bacterium]|nr:glycosyltransferase family 4 protein [bacterium]